MGRLRPALRSERLAPGIALTACVACAALLRLPFLHAGIGADEGGYAYVAEQWAHGARLYHQAWVDRPQGLLLAYRALLSLGQAAFAIRLGALLYGCAITLLLGAIGWMLKGPWTGAAAAAIYAVVGVGPHIQGFTFNGELAAALPATGGIAAALAWQRSQRALWLLAAGAAAGSALLMKQSGFDGLLVAAAIVGLGPAPWRRRLTSLALFLAAALTPLAVSALHGWLVGWESYWFAVVGYKVGAASGASAGLARRAARLGTSWLGARNDLELLALVALVGLGVTLLRRRPLWVPGLWLLAAFGGFNTASLYWGHYYVQLVAPLALLAALAATSVPTRVLPLIAVAVAASQVLLFLVRVEGSSAAEQRRLIPYYGQFETDRRVAAAIDSRSRPGDPIYALDSEADLYLLARRRSDFRFLWGHPLEEIPGALGQLRALLAGRTRPRWVIVYRRPDAVDSSGRLERILAARYRLAERIPATKITILASTTS